MRDSKGGGLAQAFKQDISRESELVKEGWRADSGTTVFMNTTRQDMFVRLTERPGMGLREMAREMAVSAPTASWHLNRLFDAGMVQMKQYGNSTRYYPNWMIDPADMDLVAVLASELPRKVLLIVMDTPGVNQKEIAKRLGKPHQSMIRVCDRLRDVGAMTILEDGRYTRYFPTEVLAVKNDKVCK